MGVPTGARKLCGRYLAAMEARGPGLLTGLYLVGSIAFDDYQEGRSDIDFVAVTSQSVLLDDVAAIHTALASARPFFDGIYVTPDDLRRPAQDASPGVAVIEGRVVDDSTAERHAVTWLTLARHGIAVAGPSPAALGVSATIEEARKHARDNLLRYWQPWHARRSALLSRAGLSSLAPAATVWAVLGVSRLHATIARGELLSKSAAGTYASDMFPNHRPVVESALALRSGGTDTFGRAHFARRQAMLAFLDDAIADALHHPS